MEGTGYCRKRYRADEERLSITEEKCMEVIITITQYKRIKFSNFSRSYIFL